MTSTINRDDRPTADSSRILIGEALERLMARGMPFRFSAYDGSAAGPADAPIHLRLHN